MKVETRITKFWARVAKRGPDECWYWQGAINWDGYGKFKIGGVAQSAHRFAYILTHGEPKNNVLHTCDNRACCNPAHLYDGTTSQNNIDRRRRTDKPGITGVKNVTYDNHTTNKKFYRVQFFSGRKCIYLRRFYTLEEAAEDAARAAKELGRD